MLFYAIYISTLLALCQITAIPIEDIGFQNVQGHDQQDRLFERAIPQEPAPVYELEVLLDHENMPSYSPVLANHGPLVKVDASTNYADLANQQTVFVHRNLAPATPLHHAASQPIAQQQDYDGVAHYEFSYSVDDEHTGDHKSQHETRHGDVVTGEYRLQQPDGSERRVEYSADHHSGFNAIVHNSVPTNHQVIDSHTG